MTATNDTPAVESPAIRFRCSDRHLEEGFGHAVDAAVSRVRTGLPGEMPCYWAGLTDRPMFYSRDVAHQALGGHLLGLDRENFAMLRHFAASATEARNHYPLWAFTFDGAPAAIDYVDDTRFVRETPAAFEITEKSLEQYLWTGDRRYLEDPAFAGYHRGLVREFLPRHDILGTGIAGEASTRDIFAGSPSYNESPEGEDMQVAGDGIAAQWAALRAVAAVVADPALAAEAAALADRAAAHFAAAWWDETAGHYLTGMAAGRTCTAFGYEPSWFPAVKGLLETGERAAAHLDFVEEGLRTNPPGNIEAFTYLPEAFFGYGRDASAVRWIRHLIDSAAAYPEVPFTVVSHLATGLTGLRPRPDGGVETRSHLAAGQVEVDAVPYRGSLLTLRHDGREMSELAVAPGGAPVRWSAHVAGRTVTREVRPGESVRVTA